MYKRLHEVSQPIFTAEVYIFHGDSILMFKRSETKKKFPGWWSLPGGHIDENEEPLSAAIREVKEETGIEISPKHAQLKVVAMHNHLDRGEMYIAFAFATEILEKPRVLKTSEEGTCHWIKKTDARTLQNVFPPIRYYFEHVFNNSSGVIYNLSEWKNSELVRVISETEEKGKYGIS